MPRMVKISDILKKFLCQPQESRFYHITEEKMLNYAKITQSGG